MPQDPFAAIAQPVTPPAIVAAGNDPFASIATPTQQRPKTLVDKWIDNPSTVPNARIRNMPNPAEGETSAAGAFYHGAKAGLTLGMLPAAPAMIPTSAAGAVSTALGVGGATVGSIAGNQIAKSAGGGELTQEVGGDVGGLVGGGLGAKAPELANTKVGQSLLTLLKPFGVAAEDLPVIGSVIKGIKATRNIPGDLNDIWNGKSAPKSPVPETDNLAPPGGKPAVPEESTENRLPTAFQPLPAKAPQVPGTVDSPLKTLSELPPKVISQALTELGPKAPIAEVTSRANTIARLSSLLNEGLGGRGLEPNVPLKDQGGVVTPKPVETIPEGHTPVESSAIKSYKYDPATREFDTVTQSGSRYIHGDVSPEQAQAFEAAKSKGKAWNDLRQNSTLVAKVVNGKRIPIRPSLSDEDFISPDEWQAGHELDTGVEGTPRQ